MPRHLLAMLGNEPPLELEAAAVPTARHALSLRWLTASVLAGLAGGLLLGSAIYVSSQGQITFAETAEPAPAAAPRDAGSAGLRKADKLVRAETAAAAKQAFRAPMTIRSGTREIIKVRGFTRISTGLSLTSGVYAANIPPFNPMRFFSQDGGERAFDPPPETSDADVSVLKTDLSTIVLDPGGPTLSDADVASQLAAEARDGHGSGRLSSLPLPPALLAPRALTAGVPGAAGVPGPFGTGRDAAFRQIEVRVVPENVTSLPKTSARSGDLAFEERTVPVRRGDTLDGVLRANGAAADEARVIVGVLGGRDRAVEGLQLRLLLAPAERAGDPRTIVRAILFGERGIEAIAAMNDRRAFVSVAPPPAEAPRPEPGRGGDDEEEDEGTGVRLHDSLYETVMKQGLPGQAAEELERIFGYDVDFQRRVSPGDSIELFYTTDEEGGGGDRTEILSASLTIGQDTRRVFRFQAEDGAVEYLDEAGRSLRKFLIRKPVVEARLSSGFGARFHPILGYSKMHTGVDWAAKAGTPILAAGNGTVISADWNSGYGRRTEIQHANGYVTAYNHQSAFGRGIVAGARVRQGQVIGYVGSTGLSTGAHLHFEVIVNGHFVDPMKIRVPRGRELDGRMLADFSRQRDQIEELAKKAGAANRFAASEIR